MVNGYACLYGDMYVYRYPPMIKTCPFKAIIQYSDVVFSVDRYPTFVALLVNENGMRVDFQLKKPRLLAQKHYLWL